MQSVILAAGEGTRMKPLTNHLSTTMIPIANKPIIDWQVDVLSFIADEVIIVVNKNQKDIVDYFGNRKHVKFRYQEKQLGVVDALSYVEKDIKDKFILIYGNEIIHKDDLKQISRLNGYYFGANDAGIFLFDKDIFKFLGNRKELAEVLEEMKKNGQKIGPFKITNHVKIIYPWNILDANQLVLEEVGSMISKNAEIRPGVVMENPIAIGDGAVLGPNCFIRKYSVIGKNCRVGNAVETKNSIIMDDSNIAHLSYVGDTIIGRNVNVGGGTIFANLRFDEKTVGMNLDGKVVDSGRRKLGGIIGDNVKFGVNCVVMPGKKIWPNMLIPPTLVIDEDIETQPDLKNWNKQKSN